jgi:phosphoribosylformylglycinamidine (FGAM) synthase-like enzyme
MLLGMQVVKLGGPVYRIGVGGGSASSVEVRKLTIISAISIIYMQDPSIMAWLLKLGYDLF